MRATSEDHTITHTHGSIGGLEMPVQQIRRSWAVLVIWGSMCAPTVRWPATNRSRPAIKVGFGNPEEEQRRVRERERARMTPKGRGWCPYEAGNTGIAAYAVTHQLIDGVIIKSSRAGKYGQERTKIRTWLLDTCRSPKAESAQRRVGVVAGEQQAAASQTRSYR